ncbi:hypothetical protein HDC90_004092 [Pedobacter sp. AK013]|nr:hypothetical protein [Pedobacter sp. AK013]
MSQASVFLFNKASYQNPCFSEVKCYHLTIGNIPVNMDNPIFAVSDGNI